MTLAIITLLEYQDDERECPKCGSSPTLSRECDNGCDNGFVDPYDEDPINFSQGEELETCPECNGAGMHWWCPECDADLPNGRKTKP